MATSSTNHGGGWGISHSGVEGVRYAKKCVMRKSLFYGKKFHSAAGEKKLVRK